MYQYLWHTPDGSDGKQSACNAGDPGLIPESRGDNGYPLQYSCLENSMDRGAWWGKEPPEEPRGCKQSGMS